MANQTLPNFLVIGTEKGGTTWLYQQLKKHPDIFLPESKELHFFNRYSSNLVNRNNFTLGLQWYGDFFKGHKGQKAIGEVTPMYICDPEAPGRIKETLPDAKLIAVLRNPVNRAYSHYWMAKNKKHVKLCFRKIIETEEPRFIKRGLYYEQLEVYYKLFKPEQILVIFYEEVFENPSFWMARVCDFLGIDGSFYSRNDISLHEKVYQSAGYKSAVLLNVKNFITQKLRRNRSAGRVIDFFKRKGVSKAFKKINSVEKQYEKINEEDEIMLKNYYREDLEKLSLLLKRQLPF